MLWHNNVTQMCCNYATEVIIVPIILPIRDLVFKRLINCCVLRRTARILWTQHYL